MGNTVYSISLGKVIKDNALEVLYTPTNENDIFITTAEVSRPGLILSGYVKFFDQLRIQIMGFTEMGFLDSLSQVEREESLERFFKAHPQAVVISRGIEAYPEMKVFAEKYEVPLLRSTESTSSFMATLIAYLNVELAPRITRHGVLVEVYGEGVLILGDSGVGKSETAIELIKRGHRLIADDAVEIRQVSSRTLVGASPENIRHFIELRGIGIINARRIFGMGAVKTTEKIDMVIQLEPWDSEKTYDRMGLDNEFTKILDIKVPVTTVPVKPGRNLAIIIEVAAMNNRQKKMGYNAAKELLHNLGIEEEVPNEVELEIWHNY